MKTFKRFWYEISHFENIDNYVTIFGAVTLAVLDLLDVDISPKINSLILGVLALLGFSNLRNRHQIDDLHRSLTESASNFFIQEFPVKWKKEFEKAEEVWLFGVSLSRTINYNYEEIQRKLHQGHTLKVMVVNPEGPGIEMAMARHFPRKEIDPKRVGIQQTLKLLGDLQKITPGKLEIRTIQFPLAYGVVAINPNASSGVLYIEHYAFYVTTESLPRYLIDANDGYWFDFYRNEIKALWDYGKDWNQ